MRWLLTLRGRWARSVDGMLTLKEVQPGVSGDHATEEGEGGASTFPPPLSATAALLSAVGVASPVEGRWALIRDHVGFHEMVDLFLAAYSSRMMQYGACTQYICIQYIYVSIYVSIYVYILYEYVQLSW